MIPEKIDRYFIKEKLGQGGMATVYRAQDPRFKRDVAIKVLPPAYLSNETFKARFEREAQVIASLEYPGIVPVYDFGEENGQPYLVMRFMPGGSLADRISQRPLQLEDIIRIFSRLAPALDHFHAQGIVHRDLKPGNILFDQYDTAYISDFGIARLSEGTTSLTGEALIGTPAYMSPEQAQGLRDIDGRSDIYALGAILYEALTGKQPYEATTPMGVILKHITEPAPRLHSIKADLPEELELVIERSMEKDRARRYPTASAMVVDLISLHEKHFPGGPGILSQEPLEAPDKRPARPSPEERPKRKPDMQPASLEETSTVLEHEQVLSQPAGKMESISTDLDRKAMQAEAQKPSSVPPFILPEAEKAASGEYMERELKGTGIVSPVGKRPKRKINPLWFAGGVLILGLICGFFLFSGWFMSTFFASPTEEISQNQISQFEATETSITDERPPTKNVGNGDCNDDFSDPESGWWTYKGEEGLMDYHSGSFNIRVDMPNWYLINNPGCKITDATIEVDAYKSGGPEENIFGLICRYQDSENFYFLVIGSSGYYGIGKVEQGKPVLISNQDDAFSTAINQGRTSNRLRADCVGNDLIFYANNTKLAEVQAYDFDTGEVGLFVGTFDIYGVNILFDNFKVSEISRP